MHDKYKSHYVNAYLIIETQEGLLLSLRQNTGYEDNKWGFVAGHCEPMETATQALCREAQEEIGITVSPQDLEIVHIMHRFSNRSNIDIFMRATTWQGHIQNCEPHKCGGIRFFLTLPDNTIDYIRHVLTLIRTNQFYSEVSA